MGQDCSSKLAMISFEEGLAKNINCEDEINEFVIEKARKFGNI